eukprot:251135-Chlamydomonas_euryale.AAC.2
MRVVGGAPLANKPTSAHLLRCRWDAGTTLTARFATKVAAGTAAALAYLVGSPAGVWPEGMGEEVCGVGVGVDVGARVQHRRWPAWWVRREGGGRG